MKYLTEKKKKTGQIQTYDFGLPQFVEDQEGMIEVNYTIRHNRLYMFTD